MAISISTRAATAAAALALLAGCSGGGTPSTPGAGSLGTQSHAGRLVSHARVPSLVPDSVLARAPHRTGSKPVAFNGAPSSGIYVSDFGNSIIYILTTGGKLVGQLTDAVNPQGLAVDHAGNLWAASTGSFSVNEYAPGATSATNVLSDTAGYPVDVTVDKNGYVFVADIFNSSGGPGAIHVYAPGATTSSLDINDPAISSARFIDTDSAGNLYAGYFDTNGAVQVVYYTNPETGGSGPINTGITNGFPGGIKVAGKATKKSSAQDLWVDDQVAPAIEEYSLPGLSELNSFNPGFGDPVDFGFNKASSQFAVADAVNLLVYKVNAKTGSFVGKPLGGKLGLSVPIDAQPFPSNK
jgi:hypothetical protein